MNSATHIIYTVVGNLPESYKLVNWKYNGKIIPSHLATVAFSKYLLEKNEKVILKILIPHSLFVKKNTKEIIKNFFNFQTLKKLFKKDFTYKVGSFIEKNLEVEIIPSYGVYKFGEFWIDYSEISVYGRILYNYLQFIKDFLPLIEGHEDVHIYFDISIGLNNLLIEVLEAFYNAIVFWNFYYLNENNPAKFYLLSAEPIIGSSIQDKPKIFSIEQIEKLAFFEKPLNWTNYTEKFHSSLGQYIQKLDDVVKQSIYLFNVIKYALPLALFLNKVNKNEEESSYFSQNSILNVLKELINQLEPNYDIQNNDNYKTVNLKFKLLNDETINAEIFRDIRNLTYLLILGANLIKNIQKFLEDYFPKNEEGLLVSKRYNKILINLNKEENKTNYSLDDVLKTKLIDLFNHYRLYINAFFLNREWEAQNRNLKNRASTLEKVKTNECWNLCGINNNFKNYETKCLISKDALFKDEGQIRNFLAHLGFEEKITYICRKEEEIYLKYKEEFIDLIKELIYNDFKLNTHSSNHP
jgi:hypothetical protein